MRLRRYLFGSFICLAAHALAVPEVLIVQSARIQLKMTPLPQPPGKVPPSNQASEPNDKPGAPLDVADALAEELYTSGRVSPIVWSLGDPIFRSAVNDGILTSPPDDPTLEEAQAVQKKLKTEMLLIVTAYRDSDQLKGIAELYRGSKLIWRNEKMMSATLGGRFDKDGAAKSLARTWSEIMAQGPLKPFVPSPVQSTPEPDPGLAPKAPDVATPTVPKATENSKLFSDAESLVKGGQTAQGIGMLRDAVDAEPSDLERRRELVTVLMMAKKPELAAMEARRASQLFPNDAGFYMSAAKAWLSAGRPDEAQSDLNEVVARNPSGGEAREMLGEAALWQMKTPAAIEHFDAALKEKPSGEVQLYRALARAIAGDQEEATIDLDALGPLNPATAESRYSYCVLVIDKAVNQASDEIRPLFDAALAKPGKDVSEGVGYQSKRILGIVAVLGRLASPSTHVKSHERRLLALKLLAESLSDLGAYLDSPSDETLSDARINLGEALKQLAAANEVYRSEIKEQAQGERVGQ